jgi:hypothetical protein
MCTRSWSGSGFDCENEKKTCTAHFSLKLSSSSLSFKKIIFGKFTYSVLVWMSDYLATVQILPCLLHKERVRDSKGKIRGT